jgi:hypothetical protein
VCLLREQSMLVSLTEALAIDPAVASLVLDPAHYAT